jgi:hypothetical protein
VFREDFPPPPDTTHVLEFLPEHLSADGFPLGWDLQTLANYEANTPQDTYDVPDTPDVSNPLPWLAGWAAEQVGYPVHLIVGEQQFKTARFALRRWRYEPMAYVVRCTCDGPCERKVHGW